MVKSYEKQNKSKADIAKENREKNLEKASGGGGIHAGKSKDKIAKEKSFVAKQKVKEAKKAPTVKEKKDLDATQKRESTHPIFKKKGKDVEIKQKPKVKIKAKSRHEIAIKKRQDALEKARKEPKVSTPEKHPAHDPDKGGGIHRGKPPKGKYKKPPKGAQAAEVDRGGKSSGPKEKKKLSGISAKEKARIAKKKADAKAAATREEGRKPKKAETKKQAETGTRETSYEARVKALVAKKASLSKKETADGRSEYQVQMHKLKKENKKAWKKMFKGGKLKK
tara:strand:- start:240 stop:1079 length:840 start_codon:yes stop_codon:yes gene_type:complete